jgi:hypothetical protein
LAQVDREPACPGRRVKYGEELVHRLRPRGYLIQTASDGLIVDVLANVSWRQDLSPTAIFISDTGVCEHLTERVKWPILVLQGSHKCLQGGKDGIGYRLKLSPQGLEPCRVSENVNQHPESHPLVGGVSPDHRVHIGKHSGWSTKRVVADRL